MDKRRTFTVDQYIDIYDSYLTEIATRQNMSIKAIRELFRYFLKLFVFRALPEQGELEFPLGSGIFYKRVGMSRFQVRVEREKSRRWLSNNE